jgi:glycosyltransferase involved in cell wall biosynthesis
MTRLLRVVHVTPGLEVGGLEKLLVEFARHADRRQFHLHFVSLSNPGLLAGDIQALGWPVTALEQPQGLRPSLIVRLARLFRQLRADIVHTHDDRANIYGAPAARLAGVPVVLHTRHHQGSQLTPRQRWLIRAVSLADSRFVCISHDSARWAARQGIPRGKLRVVHNGIDTDRFTFTGPDPAGYAVFVGRLVPEKDIGTLLQAVALLTCTLPDFRLLIAGDGPERGSLQQRTEQLGLGERVAFLGNVREVPALLARARLFVLSSLTEGISLTLLEAMARGLPVVATSSGRQPRSGGRWTDRPARSSPRSPGDGRPDSATLARPVSRRCLWGWLDESGFWSILTSGRWSLVTSSCTSRRAAPPVVVF